MSELVIKKMIRKYGQTVRHKKKVSSVVEGEEEITYTDEEPKRGQFDQLTAFDVIFDRFGFRTEADYIGTFLPGTDINEGDLLLVDGNWLEVTNVLRRRTGSTEDYFEVLLRKKK